MFSEPKFWKLRNTYFVNRIYGFIYMTKKANEQNLILYLKITALEPIFQLELRVFVKQVGLRGYLLKTRGFS